MDVSRHYCVVPEIVPVDSAVQPYIDYSGPQFLFNGSEKEVATDDAELEVALGEGKEAYVIEGFEQEESTQERLKIYQWRWASGDEVYGRLLEFTRSHIAGGSC